jgi:hypothetical protein
MSAEQRLVAADAFWREDQAEIEAQHVDAIVSIARRLNFRPKSVQALPVERRAKLLAQQGDVSDAVATRALISYHFAARRPLMAAFLDALGIPHDDGIINEESVPPPSRDRLAEAIATLRSSYGKQDVDLYLWTLATLDGETWVDLEAALMSEG